MIAEFSFRFDEPIVCTAIHNGHLMSTAFKENLGISEADQLREEDPFTGYFTLISNNRIIGRFSRFEVDLNRAPETAIYLKPEDAWDLPVRKYPLPDDVVAIARQRYALFYSRTKLFFQEMEDTFGKFFVFDIHSYNHRRNGPLAPPDDPELNPDIILGTNNMSESWLPLVEKLRDNLANADFFGRKLDVRINVKFTGGNFSRWIHKSFPESVCCVSLEFKKIFMDEWTGERHLKVQERLREVLEGSFEMIKMNL